MANFEQEQSRDVEIQNAKDEIRMREDAGEDVEREKIALIEKIYSEDSSKEEKEGFDEWFLHVPENSSEKPISVASIEEIERFLPKYSNYNGERITLFFAKETFLPDELQMIMENFSRRDPSFEISITKHRDDLISMGIGGKIRNTSVDFGGKYLGHYHPTRFELENKEALPNCFIAGLMPSAGDLKGFLNHPESVREGTKIFSKNGYVSFQLSEEEGNYDKSLEEFKQKYFDLFLGENKLGLKSDEEVKEYFKENFGTEISFHYYKEESSDR